MSPFLPFTNRADGPREGRGCRAAGKAAYDNRRDLGGDAARRVVEVSGEQRPTAWQQAAGAQATRNAKRQPRSARRLRRSAGSAMMPHAPGQRHQERLGPALGLRFVPPSVALRANFLTNLGNPCPRGWLGLTRKLPYERAAPVLRAVGTPAAHEEGCRL
jgi:hypothetical protein